MKQGSFVAYAGGDGVYARINLGTTPAIMVFDGFNRTPICVKTEAIELRPR